MATELGPEIFWSIGLKFKSFRQELANKKTAQKKKAVLRYTNLVIITTVLRKKVLSENVMGRHYRQIVFSTDSAVGVFNEGRVGETFNDRS